MANSFVQRRSQGTDLYDVLRFPDAIAFEEELRRCNKMAIPLGNRSVTNKCYALLSKVNFFPSSVFEGVDVVHGMLQMPLYVPCLVLLAADTDIDGLLGSIQALCVKNGIPHIFIPSKAYIGDALNLGRDVLAVLISFDNDAGYRIEFEDAFEGIQSQCFGRKRRHHRGNLTSTTPAVEPKGEMVNTSVSTVPTGVRISELVDEPSSSSSWVTIATMTDDDSETASKDFSVNIPQDEAMEEDFEEYIRVASPTPAFPPSQMTHLQSQFNLNMHIGEGSSSTMSSDDSPRPGPSHQGTSGAMAPRKRPPTSSTTDIVHKRRTRLLSLPLKFYFHSDDGSSEARDDDGSGEGPASTIEARSNSSGNSSPQDVETDEQ
ncbi:hypothetical protein HHI36_023486 [Cryptolaemus montrouzieri]|uniref:Ribosomal protein eL8/eL30/eS12/Gadd45 domain-containing protein n=1 Tax=Cryptolaemus montrouzieri TaxID=559131 RepID=A0ABD2PIC4_9CUCU